jgi:predicted Ser/Thr protein kinase
MATVAEEMTSNGSAAHARSDPAKPVIAGNYEVDLEHPLGSGGMAVVYRGRDLRNRRDVALKTLRLEYRRDPDTRAKFRREARTMTFLAHPNVVRVYDLFEDGNAPWVVLEFAPGRSLKEEIAARGPLPVEETARLLEQIAKALDHLHDRGLVHLDVKPQNLIVSPERKVKLIDFGLAQRSGAPQEMIGGSAFGTAAYLSPEQACGEPVDASTDVYSLGCVVFEMLTGQPPFGADGTAAVKNDVIRAHLQDEPAAPSSLIPLPAWVDDAVLLALAKKPRDRYRDCTSFARVFWAGLDEPDGIVAIQTPTAKVWSPPVIDTYLENERALQERANGSVGFGGRVAGGFYRTGGKIARHTGWLQRTLWRATLALLVGNIMLAALLYVDRGEIPGVYANDTVLHAGGTAHVTTADLRLRDQPGRESDILGELAEGQSVAITGQAVDTGGEVWWPVRATVDGVATEGFVAGGWIAPEQSPKEVWLQRAKDEVETWPGKIVHHVRD